MVSEQNWPFDPHSYIFLLRAVELVGREQHGENWMLKARLPLLPVFDPDAADWTNARMSQTLNTLFSRPDVASSISEFQFFHDAYQLTVRQIEVKRRIARMEQARSASSSISNSSSWKPSAIKRQPMPTGGNAGRYQDIIDPTVQDVCRETLVGITKEQWLELARIIFAESKAIQSAHDKLEAISVRIIRAFEAGELSSSVRLPDGSMVDIPREHWNGENIWPRFVDARYDPSNPFQSKRASGTRMLIFLPLDSFSAWLEPQCNTSVRAGALEKHDWEEARLFMLKLLEERGDFLDSQNKAPGWRSQNDMANLIIEHLENRVGMEPGEGPSPSGMKAKLKDWLKDWRSGQ